MKNLLFRWRSFTPIPFLIAGLFLEDFRPVWFAAGLSLALSGELIRLWAVGHAGSITRTRNVGAPELVTSGPYARVRNPLYTGNMLLYVGLITAMAPRWPWLIALVLAWFWFQYTLIIQLEEEKLIQLFGEQYLEYSKAVPRIFPRFTPWSGNGANNTPRAMNWTKAWRSEQRTLQALLITVILILAARCLHGICGY
jgi:protein-S-isoprenylcysteine O-methyltransferase Ste14